MRRGLGGAIVLALVAGVIPGWTGTAQAATQDFFTLTSTNEFFVQASHTACDRVTDDGNIKYTLVLTQTMLDHMNYSVSQGHDVKVEWETAQEPLIGNVDNQTRNKVTIDLKKLDTSSGTKTVLGTHLDQRTFLKNQAGTQIDWTNNLSTNTINGLAVGDKLRIVAHGVVKADPDKSGNGCVSGDDPSMRWKFMPAGTPNVHSY